jgi:hypothetical protein
LEKELVGSSIAALSMTPTGQILKRERVTPLLTGLEVRKQRTARLWRDPLGEVKFAEAARRMLRLERETMVARSSCAIQTHQS